MCKLLGLAVSACSAAILIVAPAAAQAPYPIADRAVTKTAVPLPAATTATNAVAPVNYYVTPGLEDSQDGSYATPSLEDTQLNYYVTPGLTDSQYAFNLNTIGKIYSSIPPYAYGYNPYPQRIVYPNAPFFSRPMRGWAAFRPYTGYNASFHPGYTVTPQGFYYPPYPF